MSGGRLLPLLLLAAAACEDPAQVILTVEDPHGLAADATRLVIGRRAENEPKEEREVAGRSFPLTMTLTSKPGVRGTVWVDALSGSAVLARGLTELHFEGAIGSATIRLARACSAAPECDDGRFCNGVETCATSGVCEPGPAPCGALELVCAAVVCVEERRACAISQDPIVDDGDPCTLDGCTDTGPVHRPSKDLDGTYCSLEGAGAAVCNDGSCAPSSCGDGVVDYRTEQCDGRAPCSFCTCSDRCGIMNPRSDAERPTLLGMWVRRDGQSVLLASEGVDGKLALEAYDTERGVSLGTSSPGVAFHFSHGASIQLEDGRILFVGAGDSSAWLCESCQGPPPWTLARAPLPPIPSRDHPGIAELRDGRVLLVGGFAQGSGTSMPLQSTALFDPRSNTWSTTADLNCARGWPLVLVLASGKVLVLGGRECPPETYDPVSGTWTLKSEHPLTTPIYGTPLPDGRVLVVSNAGGARMEQYQPDVDWWTAVHDASVNETHPGHIALLTTARGRVAVVAGGDAPYGREAGHVYFFDPSTAAVTRGPSLQIPLYAPAAALLADGRIVISGRGYAGPVREPVQGRPVVVVSEPP